MTARKKTIARAAPPPVYAPPDAQQVYVRVPLAPEVIAALREHADNAARLAELVTGGAADPALVLQAIAKTAAALQRDGVKIRARLKKRRR